MTELKKADPGTLKLVALARRYKAAARCLECGRQVRGIPQEELHFKPKLMSCTSEMCTSRTTLHLDYTQAKVPADALTTLAILKPDDVNTGAVLVGATGLFHRAQRVVEYLVDEELTWPHHDKSVSFVERAKAR